MACKPFKHGEASMKFGDALKELGLGKRLQRTG